MVEATKYHRIEIPEISYTDQFTSIAHATMLLSSLSVQSGLQPNSDIKMMVRADDEDAGQDSILHLSKNRYTSHLIIF